MSSSLPVSRIKTIMKSSPEVENISPGSAVLVGRATELFIGFLTTEAFKISIDKRKLEYKSIAEVVQSDDRLDFLREMVPRKITVREFKEILKRKKKQQTRQVEESSNDNESSNSSENTDSGSEETDEDSEDSDLSESDDSDE